MSVLFPDIDHAVFELGISIFLSVVINPLSIKYPSLALLGDSNLTFSSLSKVILYSLKVKSSIAAPLRDIEPIILLFSNLILLLWLKASSLETSVIVSFWSKLGASVVCSVLFFSASCCWF